MPPDSPLVTQIAPSPNFGERQRPLDRIILHYTGMDSANSAIRLLCDAQAQVSAHYVLLEDGGVVQLVEEQARAWHAGKSFWAGERDLNSCSIGIEIVNGGHDYGLPDFPEPQVAALLALLSDICARRNIEKTRILGHSDIAPARKKDPGEKFPWARLAQEGFGLYVPPAPIEPGPVFARDALGPPVAALQLLLARLGHDLTPSGFYDEATELAVASVQRHWRPEKIDGIADLSTLKILRALLDCF